MVTVNTIAVSASMTCPITAPIRPTATDAPIPVARSSVGKISENVGYAETHAQVAKDAATVKATSTRADRRPGFLITASNVAELAIGLGLIFGVASRLAAVGGLLLIFPIWVMLWDTNQYLWTYPAEDLFPLLLLAIVPAGRTAGLDARLATRFGGRWPSDPDPGFHLGWLACDEHQAPHHM